MLRQVYLDPSEVVFYVVFFDVFCSKIADNVWCGPWLAAQQRDGFHPKPPSPRAVFGSGSGSRAGRLAGGTG